MSHSYKTEESTKSIESYIRDDLEPQQYITTTETTTHEQNIQQYDSVDGKEVDHVTSAAGVAKVEAAQKVWGRLGYILLLVGLALASYIYSLDGVTTWQYLAYATSSVLNHSLSGTVQTAGSIIIAVGKPFMAKLSDYIGRGETYVVVLLFYVVGYVLYASAHNISQIAGAQILYSFGYTGLQMLTQIVLADVTTLRYRAFAGGVMSMPFVINGFISAEVVTGVMNGGGWRWGYGMFAILVPVCLAPVIISLLYGQYKARKLNLLKEEADPNKSIFKNPVKAITICAKEMDIPGLILVAAALALILLPLGLAAGSSRGWNTPSMIAMIVIGCLLVPVFITWELVFAEKWGYHPIAPLRFFKNLNIAAACFIGFFDFVSFYLQYTYQYSFVSVVKTEWNYRDLTYFSMTQTIALCVFGLAAGFILIYWRRPKWLLIIGLLIRLLGVGLMIHSRGALGSDAELIWSQLLQGIGGGFAAVITQLVAQALVSHNDVAVVTALVLLITEIGNSVGSAIATSVWTNQMPSELAAHVPTTNATLLAELYSSITTIATYPAGDPIREGVIEAYSVVMRNLCIGATVVAIFPPIVAFFFITDIHLDDKQNHLEDKTLTGDRAADEKGDNNV